MAGEGERFLVTGGAGFIGSALVRALLARGATERVVVLDAFTYAANPASLDEVAGDPRLIVLRGDVAVAGEVRDALAVGLPHTVLHLAAESHVDRSLDGPGAFARTNVGGTLCLLEGLRGYLRDAPVEARAKLRMVCVSTDEVFGSLGPDDPPFAEDTPYAPRSPYAATKAAADHLALAYHATWGLNVVLTHGPNTYGPRQHPEKLVPRMITEALAARALPLYGDGLQAREWLHVEDHAAGILAAAARGSPGRRYCLGGAPTLPNLDVVGLLCALLEQASPLGENPSAAAFEKREDAMLLRYRDLIERVTDRPGHDRRYAMSGRRARAELGWSPTRTLVEGLEETARWYAANPAWVARSLAGCGAGRAGLGALADEAASPPVSER